MLPLTQNNILSKESSRNHNQHRTPYDPAPLYLRTLWRYTNAVIIIIIIIIT